MGFERTHPVGGWCRLPTLTDGGAIPLKFGRLDIPASVDNREYCTPIEDQGSKPWCAAYTAAAFAENVLWRRDGRITEVDPEPIYAWAKAHDGNPNEDGTALDVVLKALLEKRIFDPEICKVRFVGRALIGANVDEIKTAVHRFGCFLAGFDITDEWYNARECGCITGEKANPLGGHAVLVCGYDKDGVWIENSWGLGWGIDGFGFLTWGAVRKQFMYGTVLSNCLNGFK